MQVHSYEKSDACSIEKVGFLYIQKYEVDENIIIACCKETALLYHRRFVLLSKVLNDGSMNLEIERCRICVMKQNKAYEIMTNKNFCSISPTKRANRSMNQYNSIELVMIIIYLV